MTPAESGRHIPATRPAGRRSAIVVGGSLAGLSAANWLRDAGFAVEILERSARPLQDRGAGIVLHPSTIRYLAQRRGVELDAVSLGVSRVRYLRRGEGIVSDAPSRLRFAAYGVLYAELLAAFGARDYHLGNEVRAVRDRDHHAEAELADGRVLTADVVVCADGIRSGARRALLPEVGASLAGYVAWRGVAPGAELSRMASAILSDAITYTIMPNSHLLTYPIAGGPSRLMNWVWYRNVGAGAELTDLLTDDQGRVHDFSVPAGLIPAQRVAALREDARGVLPDAVAEVIGKTADPFLQVVCDVEPPRLAFGRICLLGDAAFAARPHAAAGTAKACEDAWRLAAALAECDDVRCALARWQAGGLDLGRNLVRRSRQAGIRSQFDCTWRVGDPLPFGLYEVGDSEF